MFSAISKNLNWEILTKNSVTFIRRDRVKDKKFKYYGIVVFLMGREVNTPMHTMSSLS